jgi:hypothetical protein
MSNLVESSSTISANMACEWLAEARVEVLCLSASISRQSLPLQIIDTLPPISDVGAPINYLESSVLIAINLAGIHASCRAVVLNAAYRDFGTTHIPPALAFGVKTGSTCMGHG